MPVKEPSNRVRHGPLTWKQGDPILARDLSAMANQVFQVLEGGRGIQVNKMGNGVIVSATGQWGRGGGGLVSSSDPEPLEGVTQTAGDSNSGAPSNHQHGINTDLTDKPNGTFGYVSGQIKARIAGATVSLTRIE